MQGRADRFWEGPQRCKQRPACSRAALGLKGNNKIIAVSWGVALEQVSAQTRQHQTCGSADLHNATKSCTSSLGKAGVSSQLGTGG